METNFEIINHLNNELIGKVCTVWRIEETSNYLNKNPQTIVRYSLVKQCDGDKQERVTYNSITTVTKISGIIGLIKLKDINPNDHILVQLVPVLMLSIKLIADSLTSNSDIVELPIPNNYQITLINNHG